MTTSLQSTIALTTCAAGFMLAALIVAGCDGASTGGCQLPAIAPSLAGTPIPPQPIPAGAGTSTAVTVVVNAVVDSSGAATSATVVQSSQNAVVDQAAITLVRNSKFIPGNRGCGTTTPDTTTVTVPFSPSAQD